MWHFAGAGGQDSIAICNPAISHLACRLTHAMKDDATNPVLPTSRRLRREYLTIKSMLQISCTDRHGEKQGANGLCSECAGLLAYAGQRLTNCPYGENKPTCAKCPVHCYGRVPREQVREVMRYAGPRMLSRHPWQALLHLLDKLRKVRNPRPLRKRSPLG
jgi:hypothetical protein